MYTCRQTAQPTDSWLQGWVYTYEPLACVCTQHGLQTQLQRWVYTYEPLTCVCTQHGLQTRGYKDGCTPMSPWHVYVHSMVYRLVVTRMAVHLWALDMCMHTARPTDSRLQGWVYTYEPLTCVCTQHGLQTRGYKYGCTPMSSWHVYVHSTAYRLVVTRKGLCLWALDMCMHTARPTDSLLKGWVYTYEPMPHVDRHRSLQICGYKDGCTPMTPWHVYVHTTVLGCCTNCYIKCLTSCLLQQHSFWRNQWWDQTQVFLTHPADLSLNNSLWKPIDQTRPASPSCWVRFSFLTLSVSCLPVYVGIVGMASSGYLVRLWRYRYMVSYQSSM